MQTISGKERLLIVDDDRNMCETLKDIFSFKGYKCATAYHGQEAVDKHSKTPFDVSLIDLKLPDFSGIEVFKKLKGISPSMEGILVTGYASLENALEAFNEDIFGFITKPFDVENMQNMVRKAAEKRRLVADNSDLFAKTRRHNIRLNGLYCATLETASKSDTKGLFDIICSTIVRELGFKMAWVGMLDEPGKRLCPVASAGFDDEYVAGIKVNPCDPVSGRGPSGRAIKNRKYVIFPDLQAEPDYKLWRESALKKGYRSAAAFPMMTGERIFGTLNIYSSEVNGFAPEDALSLQIFADHTAHLIEKFKLMQALARAEEKYRFLVERLSDGILLLDAKGVISLANPSASVMLGVPVGELAGMRFEEFTESGTKLEPPAKSGQAPDSPPVRDEMVLKKRNGERVHALVSIGCLPEEMENCPMCMVTMVDLTGHKRLEHQAIMNDKLASIGQIAAGVAHEIKNPITYIMTNLGEIRDSMKTAAANGTCAVDPEMTELVEESLKGATHIRDIVRDLSSFSSKSPDQVESVDINSSIRFCVNIAANELKHRARVELDLDALPQIKAVKGRLQQAILNVIVNAAQSIAPGKPADNCLKISTRREGDSIHIRVTDTGCGIPNNILRRIFDPFFTTKENGAGTGLGLSITSEIIKKHGGTINIETVVGKGTVFIISLPIRGNAG